MTKAAALIQELFAGYRDITGEFMCGSGETKAAESRARALHKLLAEIYAYDIAAGEDHWAFRLKALRLAKRANIYYGTGEDGQLVPTSPERAKAFAAEYDAEDADQPVTVSKVDDNTALENLKHAMGRREPAGQSPFKRLSDAAAAMGFQTHLNSATGEIVLRGPRSYYVEKDPTKAGEGPFDLVFAEPPGYTVIISSNAGQDIPYEPGPLGTLLCAIYDRGHALDIRTTGPTLTRKLISFHCKERPTSEFIAEIERIAAEYERTVSWQSHPDKVTTGGRVTVTTATEDDMKRMAFFQAAQRAEADREEKARPATLPQLLASLFTVDELRRFVAEVWGQDHAITKAIPEDDATAFEHTAGMFASGGYLPEVWLSLLEHRPRRGADIGHVMSLTPDAMPARTYGRSTEPRPTLREAIQHAINTCSAEGGSNTPDFILAEALVAFLAAFNHGVNERDRWYGVALRPGAQEMTHDGKVLVPSKFAAVQPSGLTVKPTFTGLDDQLAASLIETSPISEDMAARLRARGLVVPGEETPGDADARAAIFAATVAAREAEGIGVPEPMTMAEIRERDERPLTAAEMVASKPQPDPAG